MSAHELTRILLSISMGCSVSAFMFMVGTAAKARSNAFVLTAFIIGAVTGTACYILIGMSM